VLRTEADELRAEIVTLVEAMAPELLRLPSVGPTSAAQILVGWSHPDRFRREAALAGTAPIPASPGMINRHPSIATATSNSAARYTLSC
jgi:transposase